MNRITLIGGSGFIGTMLSEVFLRAGHNVTVYDIVAPSPYLYGRITYQPCDIRERNQLCDLEQSDHVFVLAALLGKRCQEDPETGWKTNVIGTTNIIDALRKFNRTPSVYFMSSSNVYQAGLNIGPIPESALLNPNNLYAASKLMGENLMMAAAHSFGLRSVILRPFSVYGPGPAAGYKGHFIATWLENCKDRRPLVIHGDGQQTIDLVHVSDLAELCLKMIANNTASVQSPVFNVGGGFETSIVKIAEWFRDIDNGVTIQSNPHIHILQQHNFADITKSVNLLRYHPRVNPEDGVKALLHSYLDGR